MVLFAACLEVTAQRSHIEQEEGPSPPETVAFRHRQFLCLTRLLRGPGGELDATLFEQALLHVVQPRRSSLPEELQLLALLLDANFATVTFAMAFGYVGVGVTLSLIPRLGGGAALRSSLTARLERCYAALGRLKLLAVRIKARAGGRRALLAEILYRPPRNGLRGGMLYEQALSAFTAVARARGEGGPRPTPKERLLIRATTAAVCAPAPTGMSTTCASIWWR